MIYNFLSRRIAIFLFMVHVASSYRLVELSKDAQVYKLKFPGENEEDLLYVARAINNSFYVLGSTSINVCIDHCEFTLELYYSLDDVGSKSSLWYDAVEILQSLFSSKQNQTTCEALKSLSPFKNKYVVVKPLETCNEDVRIERKHTVLDFRCCLCLLTGVILFWNSVALSKSVTFYYTSGTALGILASSLVLIFILSRFVKKKYAAVSFMIGGWSLFAFLMSKMWENITELALVYYHYVIGYTFTTGFITFAYCYYRGPISNPRAHQIMKWAIEIVGVFLIYMGTQLPKASFTIIAILLVPRLTLMINQSAKWQNVSRKWSWFPLVKILNKFSKPKPRKLLTEDEYQRQGRIETEKALQELRKFCHSPECSPWKTMSRIESPKRFAQFIEGESHLSAHEITLYEEDMTGVSDQGQSDFMSEDDDSLDVLNLSDDAA